MAESTQEGASPAMPGRTAADVAEAIGGTVEAGSPATEIRGVSGLRGARPGDVSFVAERQYLRAAALTQASALLAPEGLGLPDGCTPDVLIRVADMNAALERLTDLFTPPGPPRIEGVHPTAQIGRDVVLGENVSVGASAVVEDGVRIGDGATVGPLAFLGHGAEIGRNTALHPRVTVCHGCRIGDNVILHPGVVIGGLGFGYVLEDSRHRPVRQIGVVIVEDDVEIGSNTTIDRARFGATRIGEGTKIDNLVMIAHNVQIGQHCIITGQCGIAGSAVLGNYVVLGAKAGLTGHVVMGDQSVAAGRSGVSKDVPAGGVVMGMPAEPAREARRRAAAVRRLPGLIRTVRKLRRKVDELSRANEATAAND